MIPIKTKLIVIINKVKPETKNLLDKIKNELTEIEFKLFTIHLKDDLCFLLHHFYSDYSNSYEYETLLVSSINNLINSFSGFSHFDYISLIGKWNNLTEERKDIFLATTVERIKTQNQLESIIYLKKVKSEKLQKLASNFITFIAKILIETDNIILDDEKDKLKDLNDIIKLSKFRINDDQYKKYIKDKFLKLSLENNNSNVVVHPSELKNLIIKSQKEIIQFDKKYLKDLLMIYNFLIVKHEQIIKSLDTINNNITVFETIDKLSELINEQVNSYNIIYYYAMHMIVNIKDENYFIFYEVHQEFDELGIFKNKFEKELTSNITDLNIELKNLRFDVVKKLSIIENQLNHVINGIDKINKNLNDIITNLATIEESISKGFNSLNHNISENFNQLNKNLTDGLSEINSSIGVGNLINAIGAYQMYKVNKNTKPKI